MTIELPAIAGLNGLETDALEFLTDRSRKFEIASGEIVFQPGKACNDFLWLSKGCLRVQMVSEGGREIVLYRVSPGDSCIMTTSCLLSDDVYNAEAIVEEDIAGFAISKATFDELLAISAAFRKAVFASFGNRLGELLGYIEEISFGRLDHRLVVYLCDHASKDQIAITHEVLARELATHREVVSRLLKEMERKGWISLGHGKIRLIDLAALNRAKNA